MTPEEELEILRYFFTWNIEWLKERMQKEQKFTPANSMFVWGVDGSIKLIDRNEETTKDINH